MSISAQSLGSDWPLAAGSVATGLSCFARLGAFADFPFSEAPTRQALSRKPLRTRSVGLKGRDFR
jgi:hypothetical protein